MRRIMTALRALLPGRARRADGEPDRKFAFHLDEGTAKHMRAGASPEKARRRALVAVGGAERYREAATDERVRRRVGDLWRDVRQGARALLRTPVVSVITILSLALGVGAATAVFSLADGVVLRPLVYGAGERLYILYEARQAGGIRNPSYPAFEDWREQLTAFEAVAYIRGDEFRLRGAEGTQRLLAGYVSHDFFAVTGTRAQLGRTFGTDVGSGSDDIVETNVAVISHALWHQRFGGADAVLGTSISTADGVFTVIGVMPRGFRVPLWADVWVPITALPAESAHVLARRDMRVDAETWGLVRAGVTEAQAQQDVARVVASLAGEYPDLAGEFTTAQIVSARDRVLGDSAGKLRILAAAVLLLLLVVCVNVAGLQLARGGARARELAVRATLGAGRGRLVRQLLTESALLAVIGGALGVLLAALAVSAYTASLPTTLPRLEEVAVDARTLLFALGISLVTALLFGVVPALRASSVAPMAALRQGAGAIGGGTRLRGALVVAQVALALVLTVGSGLLLRSLWALEQTDRGFETAGIAALRVFPPPQYADAAAAAALYDELQEAVRRVPGVSDVALTNHASLVGGWMVTRVETGAETPADGANAVIRTVSSEYFDVFGVRRLRGRLLQDADYPAVGAGIVINDALARQFFGSDDPIGRSVTIFHSSQDRPEFGEPIQAVIVGIVAGEHVFGPEQNPPPVVYVPHTWMVWGNMTLLARTSVPPHTVLSALRRAVQQVERDIPVAGAGAEWRTLQQLAAVSMEQRRLMAGLLTGFAGSALLLALLGIFGITAYVVTLRTREIGVRMAIGAQRSTVGGMILRQALLLAVLGVAIGVPATLAATRLLESELYGVAAMDPATVAVAATLFVIAALLVAALPSARAVSISPTEALRGD
jgi:putative ABC transport system permease protein